MGLANSQRHILAAIQDELQADPDLAASFSAFASVTRGTVMPEAEQLAGWRRFWRAGLLRFLDRHILLAVAIVACLATLLTLALAASSPGSHHYRCQPFSASARACHDHPSRPQMPGRR